MFGRRWTSAPSKPRVYDCSTYGKGAGCAPNVHDAEELERAVVEQVNTIAQDYRRIQDLQRSVTGRLRDALALAEREQARLDAERVRLVDAIRKGILADDDAADASSAIAEERARAIATVGELRGQLDAAESDAERAERMPREARKLLDESLPAIERKRILATVLAGSRVTLHRDGEITID